jgi:putative radical SAM enzyme (TIGR03279 family)
MAAEIKTVEAGSPAQQAGLRPGMRLRAIDGHTVCDGLDYEFYSVAENPVVTAELEGNTRNYTVRKAEYQPLGCGFESYLIDRRRHCKNNCIFCFINQLPTGLRDSLYFKDDDERLGFLFGNYITLTNLGEREAQRIIDMRFSPVNISVHTANPALRAAMMGNRRAGEALDLIPRFARAGIAMNFQLVLVPGVNDGDALRQSIRWLAGFAPACQSIAAVPVGLTRHRQGLPPIAPYTPRQAAGQLDILLEEGGLLLEKTGARLVYPGDEWFLLAGRAVPQAGFYADYPQLENGVGMWRLMYDEFFGALKAPKNAPKQTAADVAVGLLAAPLLEELAAALKKKRPGAALYVHPVTNRFFGPHITVTGLLTGADIAAQLKGKLRSGRLLLSGDMLRAEGDLMLDGATPEWLAQQLGVRVRVVPRGGKQLLAAVLDGGEL